MKCAKCSFKNSPGARFCAQCGTGLDLHDTPTENIRSAIREIERGSLMFGRYEVVEEIGSGGMGNVYRVFDRTINEMVALKIIRPEIATEKSVIERFGQELKTARKVSHRNICRMFDIGEESGVHYITMEYVTGEDLRSLIRRIGQLSVAKAIDIAKQICEGLAEAHAMGVIHRDLKPQNIMIDREGMAKIMDFGIARFVMTKGLTTTGTIIGTPEYMSPEQAEGKGVDQRSDIYSLGIVLFEALTGRVPFEGETPLSVALKHKLERPPDPRTFNVQIPGDLGSLVLRCMEKEKEKRYQTVADVLADLNLIARGLPISRKSGTDRKSPTVRRISGKRAMRRAVVSVGAILALAALAFGAWYFWLKTDAPEPVVPGPEIRLSESEPAAARVLPKIEEGAQGEEVAPERRNPPKTAVVRDTQSAVVSKTGPPNEQAGKNADPARERTAEAEIGLLIDRYVRSFKNDPIEFYRSHCTPQVYAEIGKDAELLFSVYEKFAPSASNRNIRMAGTDRAEAVFAQRLMGTRKGTSVEQEVWSGTMRWNLEKHKGAWQITRIVFQPLK